MTMRRLSLAGAILAAALAVLGGCRPAVARAPTTSKATAAAVPPAVASPPAGCAALPSRRARNAEHYKRDVACRIHARNGKDLYEGAPPPILRSVVVLSVRIDASGRPVKIGVVRSNGIRALERRAIQSVRAAAPLPAPDAAMLRRGTADITETWLFRDDGRFQVRTLASVQAASGF